MYNSANTLFSCYSSGQTAVTLVKYAPKPYLETPTIDADVQDLNSIYVMWDAVENAKDYTITCTEKGATEPSSTQTVTGDEYTFTGLKYATEYTISVVANPTDSETYYSSAAATKTLTTGNLPALATPVISTEVQNFNSIKVSWAAITGAKNYTVSYKKTSSTAAAISIDVTELEYTISNLEYSNSYTISVVANPEDETEHSKSESAKKEVATGDNPSITSYTLRFGADYNSKSVNNYTSSWSATCEGNTWDIANFNNNQNNWGYVKAGSKNAASLATITTSSALSLAISKVTITIDEVTGSAVNSIYLQVSSTNDFSSAEKITLTDVAQGNISITISSPVSNQYYKLTFDMKKRSDNGTIQISKVVYE